MRRNRFLRSFGDSSTSALALRARAGCCRSRSARGSSAIPASAPAYLDLPALLDHYLENSSHLENDLKNPGGVRQIVEASRARYLATKAGVSAARKSRPIGPVVEGSPKDRFPAQVRVLGSKNDRESRRADGV